MNEKLQPLAEKYKTSPETEEGQESLGKIYEYMDSHTLNFNKYFNNANGTGSVSATHVLSGSFIDFEKSVNFPTPDLIKVTMTTGETVYVLFSELI